MALPTAQPGDLVAIFQSGAYMARNAIALLGHPAAQEVCWSSGQSGRRLAAIPVRTDVLAATTTSSTYWGKVLAGWPGAAVVFAFIHSFSIFRSVGIRKRMP